MSKTKATVVINSDMDSCPVNVHLLLFEDLGDREGLICVAGHKRSDGKYRYFPDQEILLQKKDVMQPSRIVGWAYPPTIE